MPSELITVLRYEPFGAARDVFSHRESEALLAGPAGTGKTRAALEKLHLVLSKYPRAKGLMVRKTHMSLTATALQTYQQKVLHAADGVTFYGGSAVEPAQFRYPNGSRLMIGGMDRPTKVMSGEYDIIYVNEATELLEGDWESLTTRLRNGVVPYQQVFGDCNPDSPTHWLKLRAEAGRTVMLDSRLEDNPLLWDQRAGAWTAFGQAYIAKLDALTGVRYLRLRKGLWAAAEGLVYDGWDRALHMVDHFPIPPEWPRYWAVDFGYTNPFVWQAWAQDPDGRLYRYREIYRTQRLVEDHAADILKLHGAHMAGRILVWPASEPRPRAVICDHDAEDRATLERHLGLRTLAAAKAVSPGLQAVASRLKVAGDGRPRLFLLRDALVQRDAELVDAKKPTCTEEEIEGYVWNDKIRKEEPIKADDHGMDSTRYLVAHVDLAKSRKLLTW